MEAYFVLDEQGEPMRETNIEAWFRWFEQADRCIARTVVTPDVTVLTTFAGVDQSPEAGEAPLLFETRVYGGILNGEESQHPTRANALVAHTMFVEWCRLANSPDAGITEADFE